MAPTWLPKRNKNRKKIEAKNDQNFYTSWDRFFWDFGGFEEVKWSQVGIKIGRKSNVNLEKRFSENRTPAAAGARFFKFKGSKLGPKINQKTF